MGEQEKKVELDLILDLKSKNPNFDTILKVGMLGTRLGLTKGFAVDSLMSTQKTELGTIQDLAVLLMNLEEKGDATMLNEDLEKKVQLYSNCFRKELSSWLNDGIGIEVTIVFHPDFVMLNFRSEEALQNTDVYTQVTTLKDAFNFLGTKLEDYIVDEQKEDYLQKISQNEWPFNPSEIFLGKSNLVIKKSDTADWSFERAKADVKQITDYWQKVLLQEKKLSKGSPKPQIK